MHTLKNLKPGQKGTKELLTRYGTSLLCVRYRHDEATGERVKTVELIVRRNLHDGAPARPPVRQVPSRIRHPVASGDPAAAGTPAAPSLARSGGRTMAPENRPPRPFPRDRPAPAGQVRRRPVGPGAPALAPAARSGRVPRPAPPRGGRVGGWMWTPSSWIWAPRGLPDMGAGWVGVGTGG